jgi:hypothetical protein
MRNVQSVAHMTLINFHGMLVRLVAVGFLEASNGPFRVFPCFVAEFRVARRRLATHDDSAKSGNNSSS